MSDEAREEPDRIDGAPHPRETARLYGQDAAEATFLEAFDAGRLHHGWLISGARGVGKATLCWRIARFLLATPEVGNDGLFGETPSSPTTLEISSDHPVSHRLLAGSDPGLFHITRSHNEKTGRLRDMIVAEDVRNLNHFLHLSSTDGGRRVVIIDVADEMNTQAANALLKMLEEPPARTTLLLISHQPARLLPTIRSRCRELRLAPLGPKDMAIALTQAGIEPGDEAAALAELSGGSVGEAVRLYNLGGLNTYAEIVEIAATFPQLNRPKAIRLAETVAVRGAEARLDLLLALFDLFLCRAARCGAKGQAPSEAVPGEAQVLLRMGSSPQKARAWALCAQEIGARSRHGRSVNLDPVALVLDTVFRMQKTAAT